MYWLTFAMTDIRRQRFAEARDLNDAILANYFRDVD